MSSHVIDFNARDEILNLSIRAIGIISFNFFFKFKSYRRHRNLVSKLKVGLKSLLQQGLSEPGARFTKHLKPKIFLSAIQIVWHLRKS